MTHPVWLRIDYIVWELLALLGFFHVTIFDEWPAIFRIRRGMDDESLRICHLMKRDLENIPFFCSASRWVQSVTKKFLFRSRNFETSTVNKTSSTVFKATPDFFFNSLKWATSWVIRSSLRRLHWVLKWSSFESYWIEIASCSWTKRTSRSFPSGHWRMLSPASQSVGAIWTTHKASVRHGSREKTTCPSGSKSLLNPCTFETRSHRWVSAPLASKKLSFTLQGIESAVTAAWAVVY
jgi:hypothetical protein